MRLGGPVFEEFGSPEQWVAVHRALGFRAAFCPLPLGVDEDTVRAYADAARRADLVIAEVGAWSNPLSPDEATRSAALEKCRAALDLADRVGARCCVNIAGSRGEKWDGPCARDLDADTFDMIVESVREIVDAVKPMRSFYTLETMPWMPPDSVDSYLALLRAVDRPAFAVHFDPVNLICSPRRYFRNGEIIADFVDRLGPHIRSCHAKDILFGEKLTTHLSEVRPGLGQLDYATFLRQLGRLDVDTPLMMEHLPDAGEYALAAAHIRSVAEEVGARL